MRFTILFIVFFSIPVFLRAEVTRNFPPITDIVTDFTGTLSHEQIEKIRSRLSDSGDKSGYSGYAVIVNKTEEWNIDEYVKDYADFLQANGKIGKSAWLLYISIDDRKFALTAQSQAKPAFTPEFRNEVIYILGERLNSNDIAGAIIAASDQVKKLSNPSSPASKKSPSSDLIVFAGMAVLTVVLMMRIRFSRKPRT